MATNAQLDSVLAQAEAAAAAHQDAPPVSQSLVPAGSQANALAPLGTPNLDTFVNSAGLSVDTFIMVKPSGVRIGSDMKANIETIPVIIDMLDVTPLYTCRVEIGGNTTFYKSYDGATTPKGENFQQLVDIRSRAPGAKSSGIYQTVEIPCEIAEDVKAGGVTVEAGTVVGLTPSLTGFKEFQRFFKTLSKKNPSLLQQKLRVNLNAKLKTNKNNNEWYVLEFEFVDIAPDA